MLTQKWIEDPVTGKWILVKFRIQNETETPRRFRPDDGRQFSPTGRRNSMPVKSMSENSGKLDNYGWG